MTSPTLVIFVKSKASTSVEEMVAGVHRAISLDTLERAWDTETFDQAVVVTDDQEWARSLGPRVLVEGEGNPFHFGARLREVIGKYQIDRPVYIGGGSTPLLSSQELGEIGHQLSSSQDTLITNNLYSSDLVAFTPGKAIECIDLPATDNPLAQLLYRQAGLNPLSLPRQASTQFDVDTPTDLFILKMHPAVGHHTHRHLSSLNLDLSRVKKAMGFFTDSMAEVLVAGRVGSQVWSLLERDTACRVRLLSEERGMRALGREEQGEVRSILGFYLEQAGPSRFFQTLAELGNAAFIDSRVVFNHLGLRLSQEDRFLSDLGQPEGMENPLAREFTQAALEAPIPVVLGGHSLVSGGFMALIEAAWLEKDVQKGIVDKPERLR